MELVKNRLWIRSWPPLIFPDRLEKNSSLTTSIVYPTLASIMSWIVSDPEHLGGKPRIRGTRISVAFLLELLASGMTISEIVEEYPSLDEKSIRSALLELSEKERKAA